MTTLSLAMIVRDEQRVLWRVLKAAREFCDEIIVVDTGSRDATIGIALAAGAQVHYYPWHDDFAAARNFSFSKCTGDWILILDADDVLSDEAIAAAKQIKAEMLPVTDVNFIFTPYHYAKNPEDNEVCVKQTRERFMRRAVNPHWTGKVHECIDNVGQSFLICPDFVVDHDPPPENQERKAGRNLRILENSTTIETANLRELWQMGCELRASDRCAEALRCFERYLTLWPENVADMFEEPYMVRVEMAECYRALKDPPKALRAALEAVAYNPTRAEGYGLAAIIEHELQNIPAAFPLYLAAAACELPRHGGIINANFYRKDLLKQALDGCKKYLNDVKAQAQCP